MFVSSFGDNTEFVAREIIRQNKGKVVILQSSKRAYDFDNLQLGERNILPYDSLNVVHFIRSMFHLATAKVVFVDNYYAFLSVMNFKPGVECIQLWHAAGAVKKFGLEDPTVSGRASAAHKRFLNVYRRFDKVVVGSDEMVPIFKAAFDLSDERFLKTGIPRTDFFFDEDAVTEAKRSVLRAYPEIEGKKVILYAPTFRRDQLDGQPIALDVDELTSALDDDYILLIRMHPAVKGIDVNSDRNRVINVSSYPNMNHLLVMTDYLISDYSSLPYEFALLNRPQIFYPYDLASYEKESGFWDAYEKVVPGPVVYSTDEIIALIKENNFDLQQVQAFSDKWNRYSNGESAKALVRYVDR